MRRYAEEVRHSHGLEMQMRVGLNAGEVVVRAISNDLHVAHCHLGLGTLYLKMGRGEQAHAALSTAMTMYRTMEMTFWLPQVEAALAQASQ